MPCFHPISAFQCADRSIVFDESRKHDIIRSLNLPCGKCVGCRLEKSKQWATRVIHEAQQHEENSFITLTYADEHLPSDYGLHHEDFQVFFKNLRHLVWRKYGKKIRYYMAGEYGEQYGRPHYHACIFGFSFPDKELWKRTTSGSFIYRSPELEAIWTFGHSSVGDLTYESAAYTARYIMQKQNGDRLNPKTGKPYNAVYDFIDPTTGEVIKRRPEYNKMSLKPGIGANWLEQYESDVYPHDYVIVKGRKMKPPRYYDKIYASKNPYEFEELQYKREINGKFRSEDNTPERLADKEIVQVSKLQKLKRVLT